MRRALAPWLLPIVVSAILAASVLAEAPARLPLSPCLFRNVTGLPCPGCGMTRGFVALGHGRVGEAWRANALAPPLFAGLCAYLLYALVRAATGLRAPRLSPRARLALYLAALLLTLGSWTLSLIRHAALPAAP